MLSCKEPGGLFVICSQGNFPLWGNFRASAGSTARDASAGKPCSAHFILETIKGNSFLSNDHRSRISFANDPKYQEPSRLGSFFHRRVLASPVQGEVPRCPKSCRGSETEGLLSPTPRLRESPYYRKPVSDNSSSLSRTKTPSPAPLLTDLSYCFAQLS